MRFSAALSPSPAIRKGDEFSERDQVRPAGVLPDLVDSGFLEQNPTRLIRSSPATPGEPSCLEPDLIEATRARSGVKLGTLADRQELISEVLLGTGIPLGLLVGLNVGDVDLASGPGRSSPTLPAARLYRKTGDLSLVQRALEHPQITTTEAYARVRDDALREAVSAC